MLNWQIEHNKLTKQFSFENQTKLADFLRVIAAHADKTGHHPDASIFNCNQLKITLFTHDKQAITELDYALSRFIDKAFEQSF